MLLVYFKKIFTKMYILQQNIKIVCIKFAKYDAWQVFTYKLSIILNAYCAHLTNVKWYEKQ